MPYYGQYGPHLRIISLDSGWPAPQPTPVEDAMKVLADGAALTQARINLLGLYRHQPRTVTLQQQRDGIYLPRLARDTAEIIGAARYAPSSEGLTAALVTRGITAMVCRERERRLQGIDQEYADATGARRSLWRTHYRRGPVYRQAEALGKGVTHAAWAIGSVEYGAVQKLVEPTVLAAFGEAPAEEVQVSDLTLTAVGQLVTPQIENERELLQVAIAEY